MCVQNLEEKIAMKKIVVLTLAALTASMCGAQEYVGLTLGRSHISGGCPSGGSCQSGSMSGKLVVGASNYTRLNAVGISGYELSFIRFGRSGQKYAAPLPNQTTDNLNAGTPVYGDYELQRQSSALTAAFVARYAVLPETHLALRVGGAYVTSSKTTLLNGLRAGMVTSSYFRPYIGVGLEQQILQGLKLTAGLDWTQYSADGSKGSLVLMGIGVNQDF